MKRILSLALVLVMVLSMVPATVFAAEATPALPTAKVSEIKKDDLTFAMNFRVNSVTEEQLAYYGNWYADFELTINKKVSFDAEGTADGWLSGQYDEWSYDWVNVPFGKNAPVTIEAGETVKIMAFAAKLMDEPGLKYTFKEVYETVKDFNCGVYFDDEFLTANPDLVVKLELKMYNPANEAESYVIGETYTYVNPIVAKNTTTGKVYESVNEAMLDCAEGQTVVLLKNAAERIVYVLADTTLNLNGHALTVDYFSAFGDIIDGSIANSGLLDVPVSRFMIRKDNPQIPIRTENGYLFAEVVKFNARFDAAKSTFGFQPFIEAGMLEFLKNGSDATGVTIQVQVTWKQNDGYRSQNFVYNETLVNDFLNSYNPSTNKYKETFTLTLSGAENFEELTFTALVVSDAKVSVASSRPPLEKPEITLPSDLTATYGQTLAEIALPEGFMWQNAGTSVGAVGTNSFAALHIASNTEVMITVDVSKAQPTYTVPTNLTATYGQTLAEVVLPAGFAWVDATASVGNVGVNRFAAIFTSEDANYNAVEVEIAVTVGKADPDFDIPTNLTATYGDTLADVILPEGFAWVDATAFVGNVGVNRFAAIFTPEDANYNTVEVEIAVTVGKADPDFDIPTNLTATYGDTLADVILPEGFAWMDDTASVGNAGTNTFVVTFTPADTTNYNTVQLEVAVNVFKADPEVSYPTEYYLPYGTNLSTFKLPQGYAWKEPVGLVGDVGSHTFIAVYTPDDVDNYRIIEVPVIIHVTKVNPSVDIPENLTATYGDTLADVILPEGFAWVDDTASVGNAGTNTFVVTFTPADTHNYNTVEVTVSVDVRKADPDVTAPTGLQAVYGDTLGTVQLPAGFTWVDDMTTPVGNAGNNVFYVIYTPADLNNYNVLGMKVSVAVAKADPKYTHPTGLKAEEGETLADITLPAGFAWENPSTVLSSIGTFNYVAIYTPADIDNYNTVKVQVAVEVIRTDVQKFENKFTGDFLYRVGNMNAIKLDSLFKAVSGVTIGNVEVVVENVNGSNVTYVYAPATTWTNGTLQFTGTGVVKVTITDNDRCIPTELTLEVVDAMNATTATSATANNVVLLNNIGSGFTVSGYYTVYGNGFTLNYTGNGQYLNNGLKQGIVTVSENGTLDNLRIVAPIYPKAYLYYGSTLLGDYVQGGPYSQEGEKIRYHYQLSAVAASGNATISNCYIYGGRTNVFVNTGDVTITDTILECGTVANVQIQSNASHTVTFDGVTTIQHLVNATIGDTSKVMLGAGILVGPETTENPKIVLKGNFKQYNWVTQDDANAVSDTKVTKAIIEAALNATAYNHTINGKTASNLGIIFMNTDGATVNNETTLPYVLGNIKLTISNNSVNGQVCSLQNGSADEVFSDYENADRTTENGVYEPQFTFKPDLGGQYIEKTDDGDEHVYREGDTVHVMFPGGTSKDLDVAGLMKIEKYTGQELSVVITVTDSNGNVIPVTDGKITLTEAGIYTVTYEVTEPAAVARRNANGTTYTRQVTLVVSLKDVSVPDAYFEFDANAQKMGYYKPSWGDVKQYLPFLAGLKIYDYNGQTAYLRFDGSKDYDKVASITITGYESNKALVEIKLTDGGLIYTRFLARANSGGASTYTGKIKTSGNTIYFVNDGGTSSKDTTTTAAYWYVDYYKFIGNNGVEITSGQQTFNSTGSSASTPSGSFSTSIKYTVSFDANGGTCVQNEGYATSASAAVTLPAPKRGGYIFAGWYTAASGGTRVGGAGDSYTPGVNITLYAQWGKPCTVTYDANGGTCGTAREKYTGTSLILPSPTNGDLVFVGWFTAASSGTRVGGAGDVYNPQGDITLYAQWMEKYVISYNANGGSCSTRSEIYDGDLALPTPSRTGYKFLGWYTAASGGTKVEASYVPTASITLYAQWSQYSYSVDIKTQSNATVTVDKQNATYGETVTVTVTFSKNNSKTLTVKDASGNTILSKSDAGTYTFTMPADSVIIEASSSGGGCVTGDTLVTLADGTQKRLDEVSAQDMFLVWDFVKGEYTFAPASILMNHGYAQNTVIELTFSDGTTVKVVNFHGFFHEGSNKFVILDETNAADYIGESFIKQNGDAYSTVTLVDVNISAEYIEAWSILTAEHYNAILNGLFSLTPAEVPGSDLYLMPFAMGEDMKYDAVAMQADIEKYGLYTYEDFAPYMTVEQFNLLNLSVWKVSVGKGYITFEDILFLAGIHLN